MPNEIIGLVDKTTGISIPNADTRFATSDQGRLRTAIRRRHIQHLRIAKRPRLQTTLRQLRHIRPHSPNITADDLGKTFICSNDILTAGNTITINFPDISSDSNWDAHLGITVKIIGVARDGASFAAGDLTIQANHMFMNSASSTADVKKFTTDNTDNGFPMILEVIVAYTTRAGRRWLVANISNTGWNKVAAS